MQIPNDFLYKGLCHQIFQQKHSKFQPFLVEIRQFFKKIGLPKFLMIFYTRADVLKVNLASIQKGARDFKIMFCESVENLLLFLPSTCNHIHIGTNSVSATCLCTKETTGTTCSAFLAWVSTQNCGCQNGRTCIMSQTEHIPRIYTQPNVHRCIHVCA